MHFKIVKSNALVICVDVTTILIFTQSTISGPITIILPSETHPGQATLEPCATCGSGSLCCGGCRARCCGCSGSCCGCGTVAFVFAVGAVTPPVTFLTMKKKFSKCLFLVLTKHDIATHTKYLCSNHIPLPSPPNDSLTETNIILLSNFIIGLKRKLETLS